MRPLFLMVVALAGAACIAAAPAFDWNLPAGVTPPHVPLGNPMTQAKVELGQQLFYEPALSLDGSMSCATCHQQHRAFTETEATHRGVDGKAGKRNAMGLTNIGYVSPLTWADPSVQTLESQATNPIFGEHPVEMGMAGKEADLLRRLSADACYRKEFAEVFPESKGVITMADAAKAIAAFERTLLSFDSPWDRSQRGARSLLSDQAIRGSFLFDQKGCNTCHRGQNFTDDSFHDIGLPPADRDRGVIEKTGRKGDNNLFRTTTLRNVAVTGPFMHDGSITTLTGAVTAHTKAMGGGKAPPVSDDEAADIAAFMETLTDPAFIKGDRFAAPKMRCGKKR